MNFPKDYLDLGGGVNRGSAPTHIGDNEMVELLNWYPYATRLRRRGGVRLITSTAGWDEEITSMFPLKKSDGSWVLLVGGPTKFGKLDGTSITDLAVASSVTSIASDTRPWVFFQYQNYAYAIRPGHNQMLRLSASSVAAAGIDAPSTAPTIAQGAAGALTAADYKGVVTYYNIETGNESNPSTASNTLSLAASKKIDWSAIPVSTNPFVTARRLYRTLPGQTGEYFFVAQINNNVDTTYTGDNVEVADLGRTVSFDNGVPPSGLEVGVIWNERMFGSDGTDLYFSEYLLPEGFSEDVISVFPDDGHVIRGLLPFGDRLIIGKTNKIHYLVGTDRSDFALHTLSDAHGVKSHHSMRSAEGLFFWFGTGNVVFRSDGTSVRDISTPKVAPYLEAIPDGYDEYIVGAIFPALSWYLLSIPQTGYTENRIVLVYNYKYGTWTVFDHPDQAPQFLGDFFDTNYEHVLYASFYDNNIYEYNDADYGIDNLVNADADNKQIQAVIEMKHDDFGYPGFRTFFREVWLLIPDVSGGTIGIEAYRDDKATALIDRTASLDYPDSAWKSYRVTTSRYPGSTNHLRLTYSGTTALDLDAVHLEMGLLKRRPMRAR